MRKSGALLALALLLLVAAMHFKGALLAIPELRAAPAPTQFDTVRALERLERILGDQRPHPVDTAANDAVRERLIAEMRAVGLDPQVTDHVACYGSKRSRNIGCARVRNVHATIGPDTGNHLLIASHYDSTPAGPGAADDGIGMASSLEVAHHLAGRQLARPVTFLFTDGEEAGLLGARAFLDRDPLAKRVDSLINMEARGVTGPAIMFETSDPNGAAIAHFARSVDRPVANSLNADFAKLIPNSTDVEVLKAADWTILNFAIIGNETRYHTPGDTLASLDRRSVQHMGEQALALARDMAAGRAEAGGTKAYADILGRSLLVVPLWAALAGLGLLAVSFLFLAWRRRQGLPRALATVFAAVCASALLAFLTQTVIALIRAGSFWRGHPPVVSLAIAVSALSACLVALAWIGRRSDQRRLRAAFWLIFLLLGAGLSLVAPGGAIFFLVPPLVVLAGAVAEQRWRGSERVGGWIAFLLVFLSWAPLLHLAEALLGHGAAWMFAPIAALILLPALIELKPLIDAVRRSLVFALAAAAFLAAWAAVGLAPAYSADRKQAFTIEYLWDADSGKAQWLVSNDGAPLPAGFGAFRKGVKVPYSTRERWAAPAKGAAAAPTIERIGERRTDKGRLVSIRLNSGGADSVFLRAPANASLLAASMGGSARRFGKGTEKSPYFLRCQGRSCDGMRVDILVEGKKPVPFMLGGVTSGLPADGARLTAARPANANPQYGTDAAIGIRRIRL